MILWYELNPRVRCAFGNVFFIKTTLTGCCWVWKQKYAVDLTNCQYFQNMKELFMMLQTSFKLLLVPFQIDGRRFSCFSGCSSTFLYASFHYSIGSTSIQRCLVSGLTTASASVFVIWLNLVARSELDSGLQLEMLSASSTSALGSDYCPPAHPALPCPGLYVCTTHDVEQFIVFLGKPEKSW